MQTTPTLVALLPVLLAGACASMREHAAAPTPQRPRVSSNTGTTAEGTLELEAGASLDFDNGHDTPMTLKWGTSANTELFVGWSPIVFVDRPGPNGLGVGDLTAGVRSRLIEETDGAPSGAVQLATKLPTATEGEGIGTDEIDFFAAAIATKHLGDASLTGFYELGVLGDPLGAGQNVDHTLALAGTLAFNEDWGAIAELAGTISPETPSDPMLLTLAFAHAATAHAVFDFGVAVGLNSDAPDLQLLIGWTQNFGGTGPRR